MTLRCKKCHGVVWIQCSGEAAGEGRVNCGECGQEYLLKHWKSLRRSERALATRARQISREQGLDLPSAYSVLLDLATADDFREFGETGSTACRTAHDSCPTNGRYDRAFQPAIDAGLLTARQAAERGKRDSCAGILASRHDLPRAVALEVADNRISLLNAIRGQRNDDDAVSVTLRQRISLPVSLTLGLAAVLLFAFLLPGKGVRMTDGEGGGEWTIEDAEVRTNARGRVVQVFGPSPLSVLRAYCAAGGRHSGLVPVDVVPSSLPGNRTRLGLLHQSGSPDELLAITIREDREGRRWLAGEGSRPLIAVAAPVGVEGAVRR